MMTSPKRSIVTSMPRWVGSSPVLVVLGALFVVGVLNLVQTIAGGFALLHVAWAVVSALVLLALLLLAVGVARRGR